MTLIISDADLHQMAVKIYGPKLNRWRYSPAKQRAEQYKIVPTSFEALTPAERKNVMELCLLQLQIRVERGEATWRADG